MAKKTTKTTPAAAPEKQVNPELTKPEKFALFIEEVAKKNTAEGKVNDAELAKNDAALAARFAQYIRDFEEVAGK